MAEAVRCVVCGRLPGEECCGKCHWVHDHLDTGWDLRVRHQFQSHSEDGLLLCEVCSIPLSEHSLFTHGRAS